MRRHELGHLIGAHGHPGGPRPQRPPLRVGDVPDRGRAQPDLRGHAHRQPRPRQPLRLRCLRDRVGSGARARRRHRGEHLDVRAPADRSAGRRRARRGARADAPAAALSSRRGVSAPHHLRAAPDPGRPHASHLGPVSAAGERALRGLGSLTFGESIYPTYNLVVIVIGAAAAAGLWAFVYRTQFGVVLRATSQNMRMASALGVNVNRVYVQAFTLGCFMAGPRRRGVVPQQGAVLGMGVDALILAFVVVVIGGLGSLEGALIGALMVGFVREVGITFFPEIELAVLYLMAAVVLLSGPPASWAAHERADGDAVAAAPLLAGRLPVLARPGRPALRGPAVPDRAALLRPGLRDRRARLQPAARATPVSCPSATPPTSAWAPTRWPSS